MADQGADSDEPDRAQQHIEADRKALTPPGLTFDSTPISAPPPDHAEPATTPGVLHAAQRYGRAEPAIKNVHGGRRVGAVALGEFLGGAPDSNSATT